MDRENGSDGELKDYVCGGYFLAKVASRPSYCNSSLVPAAIVTVSPCIAETMPPRWVFNPTKMTELEKRRAAAGSGMAPNDIERLIAWTTERISRNELEVPNLFSSKQLVDEFLVAFSFDRNDWKLLALGLHHKQVSDFLKDVEPEVPRSTPQQFGPFVLHEVITRAEQPDPRGELIGFDVLGMDGYGECHSWFCNSLEEPIATELGIRPGPFGLLPTWREADACAEYASRPEVGAEPLPWYAWAVINYPI